MLLEAIALLSIGILIGIVTGLVPGIHVNLVAAALFAASPFLLRYLDPLSLGIFILSLAVTHSMLDTIPSIYLGAPDDENALSVLPGQKMLLKGEGYQAVKITIAGTYAGMIAAILLIPLFLLTAKSLFSVLKPFLPFLLLALMSFLLLREKERLWTLILFFLSGALGITVFSMPMLREPMFPLLSGLFGVSGLFLSYFENTHIPCQQTGSSIDISIPELAKSIAGSSVGVFFIQFFPGLGPAQGAAISGQLIKGIRDKGYLALVGAMGTMSVIFSLVTFFCLGNAKDGSIVVLSKIMEIDLMSFLLLVSAMLISGSISVFLVLYFSKIFSRLISKVNYRMMVICIIFFISLMSCILDGWLGLAVLAVSASIGLIAPLKGIGRNHAMGCLILPVILYLLT